MAFEIEFHRAGWLAAAIVDCAAQEQKSNQPNREPAIIVIFLSLLTIHEVYLVVHPPPLIRLCQSNPSSQRLYSYLDIFGYLCQAL